MNRCKQFFSKCFHGKNLIFSILFCVWLLAGVIIAVGEIAKRGNGVPVASSVVVSTALSFSSAPIAPVSSSAPAPSSSSSVPTTTTAPAPVTGGLCGQLTIGGTAVDCAVYYGDSEAQLGKGGGIYMGGHIPGQGGTVLVAGHTGSYFGDFASAVLGAEIVFTTDYGEYRYEIEDMQVVNETDVAACRLDAQTENIVLYTCYPFGQLTPTNKRYFIYGKFISGPALTIA